MQKKPPKEQAVIISVLQGPELLSSLSNWCGMNKLSLSDRCIVLLQYVDEIHPASEREYRKI